MAEQVFAPFRCQVAGGSRFLVVALIAILCGCPHRPEGFNATVREVSGPTVLGSCMLWRQEVPRSPLPRSFPVWFRCVVGVPSVEGWGVPDMLSDSNSEKGLRLG